MVKLYQGFKGPSTLSAIIDQIPEVFFKELTSKQLALVMETINSAYHKGKADAGAEIIDINAVYISKLERIIEWKGEQCYFTPTEKQEKTT